LFGSSSRGLFVFAYEIAGDRAPLPADRLFAHGDRLYGFVGNYAGSLRSPGPARCRQSGYVGMPVERFRSLAAPVEDFFCRVEPAELVEQGCSPFVEAC